MQGYMHGPGLGAKLSCLLHLGFLDRSHCIAASFSFWSELLSLPGHYWGAGSVTRSCLNTTQLLVWYKGSIHKV